jgi:hypothetical protein
VGRAGGAKDFSGANQEIKKGMNGETSGSLRPAGARARKADRTFRPHRWRDGEQLLHAGKAGAFAKEPLQEVTVSATKEEDVLRVVAFSRTEDLA